MTLKQAKKILACNPEGGAYYHTGIDRYYKEGVRKNAMVFCQNLKEWAHATHSNDDLISNDSFVLIRHIEKFINTSKPD